MLPSAAAGIRSFSATGVLGVAPWWRERSGCVVRRAAAGSGRCASAESPGPGVRTPCPREPGASPPSLHEDSPAADSTAAARRPARGAVAAIRSASAESRGPGGRCAHGSPTEDRSRRASSGRLRGCPYGPGSPGGPLAPGDPVNAAIPGSLARRAGGAPEGAAAGSPVQVLEATSRRARPAQATGSTVLRRPADGAGAARGLQTLDPPETRSIRLSAPRPAS